MNKAIWINILLAGLLVYGCASHKEGEHEENHEHHSIAHRFPQEKNSDYTLSTEALNAEIEKCPVTNEQGDSLGFSVPKRSVSLTHFPCSNCHNKPLSVMGSQSKDSKKSHWNIKIKHASEKMMNCQTCHTADKMDELHTLVNDPLTFDESYKLCGQCHSKQLADWKGGAHGKRLGGWAPPRVVKTCVQCHNPHSPGFESRWPSRHNTYDLQKKNVKK